MLFFDYETVAYQAAMPPEVLSRLCEIIRREFPADEMMYELHLLRACLAIRDGQITLEQAIGREAA